MWYVQIVNGAFPLEQIHLNQNKMGKKLKAFIRVQKIVENDIDNYFRDNPIVINKLTILRQEEEKIRKRLGEIR